MGPLNMILLILMFVSGVATVLLVLMHSGKGTGVSDMIASSMYNSAAGSGVWEKNLDRLTVITAVVFGLSICAMALTFPLGTILPKSPPLGHPSTRRVALFVLLELLRWAEHGL